MLLTSQICTQAQLQDPKFQSWALAFGERAEHMHRKIWEWCFIAEALQERGLLKPGTTGLGFAVGQEPLAAMFCKKGAKIVATDLFPDAAFNKGWVETNQHAENISSINSRNVCADSILQDRCSFRHVDMNDIPEDLGTYDFLWSSCSLEHLGSMKLGDTFIYKAMKHLRPGGTAVHTTEYNVSSNWRTLKRGGTVLYRRKDIERIATNLRREGHSIDIDFSLGELPADKYIDLPPYKHDPHLKLKLDRYTVTSIGLIITKGS